uniref:Uncharacterized protein LOC108950622 n=1 Tax=Phallusia mammillata TaxID=59560 RepID=A0A6F9DIN6_9ASCI|nr:uncharacterized protein LOC108950622 [Phallusia mammillata]
MTMAIAQELTFYHKHLSSSGVVIACVICTLVLVQLAVTSSSALLCYLSLTSHDDRWFTDRGTQYDATATPSVNNSNAKLSVPSGQPAFLFYAPSNDANKYTSAFRDVMKGVDKRNVSKSHATIDEDYDEETDGRKTADFSDGTTVDQLDNDTTKAPDNYLTTPANI